ncbi:carbamoyltransferase family protein [Nannocystis bainbridge]|uniref:Carbamoyltransferase N-terminal domain-containing protein n=1 Tax=Nannocystis bainbridge TaxID=2995303 RepID=A0ABT5DV23_9BACT|nr:carbamoyltransferase N-terminal domain-containing protein [Nannocystis bainbridge]MDC0717435.1 carbamoyltransferase N-terminal domain-containing protein [Nannocystis bainbridge]
MARVLGISAHYHDAAAALVVDGEVVAAIQEERLSRIKNDPGLPLTAAFACLQHAGLQPADLDAVAFYEEPFAKLERVLVHLLRHLPRTWRAFPRALAGQLGSKIWVLDHLSEGLGVPRDRVVCFDHHRSHAASALLVSPYEHAAVLVVDGVGEAHATTIWDGRGGDLRLLASVDFPHSLGLLYAGLTAYLGFAVNEGEYKVMGLAAWGQPRLREPFAKIVRLTGDGAYELDLACFAHMSDADLGFGPALERLLGPRRPPGRPWDFTRDDDRHYADVAATLQAVLEDILLGLARKARALTGADHLCLAGGVALNALANARIQAEAGFARVFVQPAAGDAGGALGAALLAARDRGDPRPGPLRSAALGLPIDASRAHAIARELGLPARRVDDPAAHAARLVAAGKIVAHARGRFEWGPRALGQRSLLACPRDPATRERMNRLIKEREPFRPFAPAVLAEKTGDFFAAEPDDMTPFMTTTARVHEAARERLGAVTHRDGTARLQTVAAERAPELHAVLTELAALGHDPVVLNTSLNGAGEPIVAGAEDALAFWLRHGVDALLVDDLLIERTP